METDQQAAIAQREARKKAAKEAREAENARVRAILFPGPDDQKAFETKLGVTFDAKKCLDSERFKDRWTTYCREPTDAKAKALTSLAESILAKKVAPGKAKSAKDDKSKSGYDKRSRSAAFTPSPAGKTPYKIPRVSAYGRRPSEDPQPSTSGTAATDNIVEEGEISLDGLVIDGAGDAASSKKSDEGREFLLFVHKGNEDRYALTKSQWTIFVEKYHEMIMEEELEGKPTPSVAWTGFSRSTGVICPKDEESQKMVKEIVAKIDVSGVNFRAWSVGEKGLFELVSVRVPATMRAEVFTGRKLVSAICKKNGFVEGPPNVILRNVEVQKGGNGRLLRLGVSETILDTFRKIGGAVEVAGTSLVIYYKGKPLVKVPEKKK
jgi:hypothetical protein